MSIDNMDEEQMRAHLKKQQNAIENKNKQIAEFKTEIKKINEKIATIEELSQAKLDELTQELEGYKKLAIPIAAFVDEVLVPEIIARLKE